MTWLMKRLAGLLEVSTFELDQNLLDRELGPSSKRYKAESYVDIQSRYYTLRF